MATLDEVKRMNILRGEGRAVVCDRHIIGFKKIEQVHNIRSKIKCGWRNCTKDGQYEIELQF